MGLELKITTAIKEAMKSKNQTALTALRAVKTAILLHKTQKSSEGELSNEDEMKLLQKPIKPNSILLQNNGRNFPPNYLHDSWRDYLYWDTELEN